jgi:hypothetical protein
MFFFIINQTGGQKEAEGVDHQHKQQTQNQH